MRVLLDTHAFLWAIGQPAKLSKKAARIIADEENDLLLSAASLWEIALKVRAPASVSTWDFSRQLA